MEFYRKLVASKKIKTAVLLTLTILYLLGLIAFFLHPGVGTILWAAALIPSIMIYIYQKQLEREESVRKAEEEAEKEEE
ncbi:MAG: hypothetical protein IKJ65_10265 [Clostridia bacterium]|nr:hypothetical protein [Clostridia bacterium]